jgi:3-hydroxyisobutyrate dehydrogenase
MDTIGFLGIGTMGEPMAKNLLKGGIPLVVWNRTPGKTDVLQDAGAKVAADPGEVFERCGIVLAMLANEAALDAALSRGTAAFQARVKDRVLVNMATIPVAYSKGLCMDVQAAGGDFVEAPVSGSRKPAEAGQLVAMLAGDPQAIEQVKPVLAPMCRQIVACGPVPNAILLKMSTNLFQIAMITAFSEASNFVVKTGLKLELFNEVLLAGQLASDILRAKAPKMERRDFSVQAAIRNVCESNRLTVETAREAGVPTPLSDVCLGLNRAALAQGYGDEDMIAVVKAYEAMTR